MRISINKERYINHDCPDIPKSVWDIYYENFNLVARNFIDLHQLNSINNISIRVNQAYKGSHKFHFYTKVNDLDEFHREISLYDEKRKYSDRKLKKLHSRFIWLKDLQNQYNIDIGTDKPNKKYEYIKSVIKEKKKTKNRVKSLISEYKEYLRLKKKFEK